MMATSASPVATLLTTCFAAPSPTLTQVASSTVNSDVKSATEAIALANEMPACRGVATVPPSYPKWRSTRARLAWTRARSAVYDAVHASLDRPGGALPDRRLAARARVRLLPSARRHAGRPGRRAHPLPGAER